MNLTFRQLRLFLALAETGSVSAAARSVHVTQPTASMQLKEMNLAVGLPLYEVIGKKVYLTEMGEALAETARSISQTWESFEQAVDATKGLTKGKLKVAVVSTAKYFMPRLIGSFCKAHPEVDISLQILNRDGVIQRLRENRDDLYIMSMPPADMDLSDEIFMPNPLVVIAASSDRRLSTAKLSLSHLKDHPFILREEGSGTRAAVERHFRKSKFKANIRLELGSNEAIKEAVAGGLGIGVISLHALHGRHKEYGVSVIDVAGFPLESRWHIVNSAAKKVSPLATAFKAHLLKNSKSIAGF